MFVVLEMNLKGLFYIHTNQFEILNVDLIRNKTTHQQKRK